MVTLEQLQKSVSAYLEMYGDKELLSIGTHSPSSSVEFELHLCDIFDGPIGENPYTGKDSIKLYKSGYTMWERDKEAMTDNSKEQPPADKKSSNKTVMEAYLKLEEKLSRMDDKPLDIQMSILWGTLTMMLSLGIIDEDKMKDLWLNCTVKQLGLK